MLVRDLFAAIARRQEVPQCRHFLTAISDRSPIDEGGWAWHAPLRARATIASAVVRACSRCGCTDGRACSNECYWTTRTTCSNCLYLPLAQAFGVGL